MRNYHLLTPEPFADPDVAKNEVSPMEECEYEWVETIWPNY